MEEQKEVVNVENKVVYSESTCVHEFGTGFLMTNPPQRKCLKCGEVVFTGTVKFVPEIVDPADENVCLSCQ